MRFGAVITIILLIIFGAIGISAAKPDMPEDLDEMLAEMRGGGYLLLAEQNDKTHKITSEGEFNALFRTDGAITFFLENLNTGDTHKVGYEENSGKKGTADDWGRAIWQFFIDLVS